jgi:hypothetical protein
MYQAVRQFLGLTLIVIGLLQLGFRASQRLRHDIPMWDFVSVYSAARTWAHGGDPYDLPSVLASWRATGLFAGREPTTWATVYPPTSLLMVLPLALLSPTAAMAIWLVLVIGMLVAQFLALADMARIRWREPLALILVGAALESAPVQFGVLSGQLSMPAISACIIAFWCVGRGREKLAGVLLGLACAIKPQIAAVFVVYYVCLRRRNVSVYAVLLAAAIGLIAVAAMQLSHVDWVRGWTQSIAASSRPGGVNDYSWADPYRDEIVDLKMPLASFVHNGLLLRIAAECIALALAAWYVGMRMREGLRSARGELLALACLCGLALMPIYHRVYDATLLVTALAWALAELDGPRRRLALGAMIVMLPLLIPFDSVQSVQNRWHGVYLLSQTWWWQSLVAPHYAWAVLAVTVVLLMAMKNERRAALAGTAGIDRSARLPAWTAART